MKKINALLKKLRKDFHQILDLDSYRQLCLEFSMLLNMIELEKKNAHRDGILDCKKLICERLEALVDG